MCEKCQELDAAIERYRRFLARVIDNAELAAGLNGLIKEAEAEKAELHHGQQKPPNP